METKTSTTILPETLLYLPGFASFLLNEHLDAFVEQLFEEAVEFDLPLLKYFMNMPEAERRAISTQTTRELLTFLAENQAREQIRHSLREWVANRLPMVNRDAIAAEDVTLVNHVRKRAMLRFVPLFTTDPYEMMELVKEIDLFATESITAGTNQYLDLFRERVQENTHFIEKVAETIPGAVYVFDVEKYENIFSNHKLPEIIGYTSAELNAFGKDAIAGLVHPDDQQELLKNLDAVRKSRNNEIHIIRYRVRRKDGRYRWLANYESVFKRKENGEVWQTIGITLDVDKEQQALASLQQREQQLVEAQNIARLGNYYWNFKGEGSFASAKALAVLDLHPGDKNFFGKIHPQDKQKVNECIERAMQAGEFTCEYRINTSQGVRYVWGRGVVDYVNGEPVGMHGTVMDLTEQHQLLQKLAEADQRHKQAEALVHIGTYEWNISADKIFWSDEMYRIYEVAETETLNTDLILHHVHPDDRETLKHRIQHSIETLQPYDFYYRIQTLSGEKIIHSRGRVVADETGKAGCIVGTDQDVTEKQTLIRRLQKSESVYKQVEEIADMGNWSRDLRTGRLQWTDQLYRIYGLEPQTEEITDERFLSFVHPDDRASVAEGVARLKTEDSQDFTFRVVTSDGTEKWLRSIAQVLRNENGEPIMIVGTEQNVTEKQRLIRKLEESQRLYKQAQELARLGNFTWDLNTNEVYWSDEVYKIYGRPYGTPMRFEDAFNAVVDEQKPAVQKAIEETIAGKQGRTINYAICRPDGEQRYVNLHTDVVLANEGQVSSIIGTAQDITERYKIEERLKASQNFLSKITDATPAIISIYNVHTGRYSFLSEGLEKLLGYKPENFLEGSNNDLYKLIHPDDLDPLLNKRRQSVEEINAQAGKKDLVFEFTYRIRHSDGQYRWVHSYQTAFDYNEAGAVEHVLAISLDVTEQQKAVETIREQEHFIQQIADASPTILYLFDVPAQRMAYINREAFFVLGYLPEEIVEEGEGITALLYHPEDLALLPARTQSRKNFQQVDSMIQYECRMKHKDGGYRWLLVREIVFKADEKGNVTQIIGAALDITRRKDMERTILQNAHQLEQSNASLEEFAYVASHDLKEPLRKISTFGDRMVASQSDRLSDEGKIYLRKIVDASQRMQNMISDLLSISMISGNREFERTSLQKIMEETLQTLEFKIEQQQAVICYDRLPEAAVVPSQFRQLFQNLISNSLKFVREGVQPVITVWAGAATDEETTRYNLRKAPAYLKLVFSDNGIGFEPESAQKIFTIFHRLHGRSEYEGSGIGLAICKKIVEHHGGAIFAAGQPGEGARFTLIIPA